MIRVKRKDDDGRRSLEVWSVERLWIFGSPHFYHLLAPLLCFACALASMILPYARGICYDV